MINSIFGFLAIDKPFGLTSHDCINRLRKIYGIKRIGHGGTLDPAVTGVLPIALGKATRLLPLLPGSKRYEGTIKLGIRTNTNDLEGEILSEEIWPNMNEDCITDCLKDFQGVIHQYPPAFSSIHIAGERAYKKARRGETFNLPLKRINIYKLELLRWEKDTGTINLSVFCSSGTYIRALARDIGEKLGCGAVLAKLCRTESSGFSIHQAISLPSNSQKEIDLKRNLINPINVLNDFVKIQLTNKEDSFWRKGQSIMIPKDRFIFPSTSQSIKNTNSKDFLLVLNDKGSLIGVAKNHPENSIIHPKIVFNAEG